MKDDTNLVPLLLGALPAVVGFLTAIWPTGERGRVRRILRLQSVMDGTPDGPGKVALVNALHDMVEEFARQERKRALRRLDGATVGTMVIVVVFGGAAALGLWLTDITWLRVIGVIIGVAATIFAGVGGGPQLFDYGDEDDDGADETEGASA